MQTWRNPAELWIVVIDFHQITVAVAHEASGIVADEQPAVGEAVADLVELVDGHVDLVQNLLQRFPEAGPWVRAVMPLDQLESLGAGQAPPADMIAGDVGGASEAVLDELEVVVDASLVVVEVLVVGER